MDIGATLPVAVVKDERNPFADSFRSDDDDLIGHQKTDFGKIVCAIGSCGSNRHSDLLSLMFQHVIGLRDLMNLFDRKDYCRQRAVF